MIRLFFRLNCSGLKARDIMFNIFFLIISSSLQLQIVFGIIIELNLKQVFLLKILIDDKHYFTGR